MKNPQVIIEKWAAVWSEVKDLKVIINERQATLDKIAAFIDSAIDKTNEQLLQNMHNLDISAELQACFTVDKYADKAYAIYDRLNKAYDVLLEIPSEAQKELMLSSMLNMYKNGPDPAMIKEEGADAVAASDESIYTNEMNKVLEAEESLRKVYDLLKGTEVQFDENMVRKAAPQIAAPKNAREAFFQSQAKIKEAEKQNAAKKEQKAEEHRKAFLAHMAGKVVDAVKETAVKVVEAVKETGIKVVKAVKKTVVKAVKTVGKNLVELKESFLAKLKSLISGEVA